MTGSLKQAKHNALPRGLISWANLPLIRLRPLSVYLFLSLCAFLPLSYDLWLFRSLFCFRWIIWSLSFSNGWPLDWPRRTPGTLIQLSVCLKYWYIFLLSFSAIYMNIHMHSISHMSHFFVALTSRLFPVWYVFFIFLFHSFATKPTWFSLFACCLCFGMHACVWVIVLSHFYTAELHIPWALLSEYISGEVNVGVSQPLIGQLSPCISVTRLHALALLSPLYGLLHTTQCIRKITYCKS